MIKSILKLTTLFSRKIRDDYVSAFSAQAAFFIIISFFPFIMFLLSIVPFFNIQESTILTIFTQIFPKAFNSFVVRVITDVYERTNSGTLISITAITALWSAGKGFFAIMKGLNSVYNIQETSHTLFIRINYKIYTLVFAIMLVASIVLFVFGNKLYFWTTRRFPVLQDLALVIISLHYCRSYYTFCILLSYLYCGT